MTHESARPTSTPTEISGDEAGGNPPEIPFALCWSAIAAP